MEDIICANCEKTLKVFKKMGMPDGTYSDTCAYCEEKFSYRLKSGFVFPWHPPRIQPVIIKGRHKYNRQDDIPVITKD